MTDVISIGQFKAIASQKKQPKYRNKRCEMDDIKFDSLRERNYYANLRRMEIAGLIRKLQVHPRYPIVINKQKVCDVVLDFSFECTKSGIVSHIDVKGMDTPVSRLKRKMVEAQYGIVVEVVR